MKGRYRGCEIEVTKEKCLAGYNMLFFNIFDDGFEVTSGYSESEDTIIDYYESMKSVVDDYRENPSDYQ